MSGTNGTVTKAAKAVAAKGLPAEATGAADSTSLKTRVVKLEAEVAELKELINKMIDGMKRAAAKQIMDNPDVRKQMEDALIAKMPIPGTADGPLDLSAL